MAASTMFLVIFLAAVILATNLTISVDFLQEMTTTAAATIESCAESSLLSVPTTVTTENSTSEPDYLNTTSTSTETTTTTTTTTTLRTTTTPTRAENDNSTDRTSSTSATTTAKITLPTTTTIASTTLSSTPTPTPPSTPTPSPTPTPPSTPTPTQTSIQTTAETSSTSTSPSTFAPTSTSSSLTISTSESVARNPTSEMTSNAAVAAPEAPSSDSLTKGFSIPTFLPAFRAFSAMLPGAISALPSGAPSLSPHQLQQQQEQQYLDAYNKHHATKNNLATLQTNVTVQLGSHAYLPCHIRRLKNKPVSWVRVGDGHILTVDQTTFIADQRFQTIFRDANEYSWSLQIKYVQDVDEGLYECQVSTEPKMSAKVYLSVVVPKTELIGDQNRFVKAGSKVALHCIVRGTLEPPSYIIWFRGKTQIPDDNKLRWYTQIDRNIFGNSSDQQNTIGSLIIPFVLKKDSGNYRCQPSNSAPVSVDLHVLSGEYSASAIMSTAPTHEKQDICFLFFILLPAVLRKT